MRLPIAVRLLPPCASISSTSNYPKTASRCGRPSRATWREEAREGWDSSPISLPRLATEVWEQIKNEDWVLTTQAFEDWALKLWDFDKSYRWPGKALEIGRAHV